MINNVAFELEVTNEVKINWNRILKGKENICN